MKKFCLALLLSLPLLAQQPTITTYSFTAEQCSPLSMLMLFPPYPGFTCTPSTVIEIIDSPNSTIRGYRLIIELDKKGKHYFESTYIESISGWATWTIYEQNIRVIRVVAVPQKDASDAIEKVF